jgi:hypothetical protein
MINAANSASLGSGRRRGFALDTAEDSAVVGGTDSLANGGTESAIDTGVTNANSSVADAISSSAGCGSSSG